MRAEPPTAAVAGRARALGARADADPCGRHDAARAGATGRSEDAIWQRYRNNLARHLIGIARDLQHRAMRQLAEQYNHRDLRPSLGPLVSLVAIAPRSMGELAGQLATSPQACGQLVDVAEKAGYVVRRADGRDGRSRTVRLTSRGRALVADARLVLREIEGDYRARLGADDFGAFVAALTMLLRELERPTRADEDLGRAVGRSIGVLPLVSVRIEKTLMRATIERGHPGLKMSHGQVLPLIGPDGARVAQLARIQRVSRQAISATARDLEGQGVLRREPDAHDRRGVVFRLTARGAHLIRDSVESLSELDQSFREILGRTRFETLRRAARTLYRGLHLEEEIFEGRDGFASERADSRNDANGQPLAFEAASSAWSAGGATTREPSAELFELAAGLRRRLGALGAKRLAAMLVELDAGMPEATSPPISTRLASRSFRARVAETESPKGESHHDL